MGSDGTRQLTTVEAVAFGEGRLWEPMSFHERMRFQFSQERLCMPFDVLHEAVEKTLGRPVWTHEFANQQRLIDEMNKIQEPPTMVEILEMIPENKRTIIVAGKKRDTHEEEND